MKYTLMLLILIILSLGCLGPEVGTEDQGDDIPKTDAPPEPHLETEATLTTTPPISTHPPTETSAPEHQETPTPSSEQDQQTVSEKSGKSVRGQGYAELIDVSDGIAGWLSKDRIVQVIDVSNPGSPSLMSTLDTPGFVQTVFRDDNYLYVGDTNGLRIMDVANPLGEPVGVLTGREFWPAAITVEGSYAYMTSGSELMIVDVADPTNPLEASRLPITGGGTVKIQVRDGYAYIAVSLGGLNVVDVRDPKNPVQVKVIPFESHTVGFKIKDSYAYLGYIVSLEQTDTDLGYAFNSVFEVLDLSTPTSPKVVGSINIPTNVKGLDLEGDYAYVIGSHPHLITIVDVSSPSNPQIKNTADDIIRESELTEAFIQDGYAYVMDSGRGLRVLDIKDPINPKLVATLELQEMLMDIHGGSGRIYLSAEQRYFNVADVSDPDNPALTSSETIPSGSYPYTAIALDEHTAYFNGDGFEVYDLKDSRAPKHLEVKGIDVDSIAIKGDYLYTTIGEVGLIVYDISDIVQPSLVSRTNFPTGIPRDFSLDGNWVVGISNSPYSITVIDVSDPHQPQAKDSYVFGKYGMSVTVKDDYIYVAQGAGGVDILKIEPDGSLKFVTNFPAKGNVFRVVVSGNRAYLLKGGSGIDILDVTDPSQPALLEHVYSQGEALQGRILEGYLYLADGSSGLTVIPVGTN